MAVPAGGYAWWYVDALSDPAPDGTVWALTVIVFVGSVFSPYYAWQRRRRGDDAAIANRHQSINVSLYRRAPGGRRFSKWWSMTERDAADGRRDDTSLRIGPSRCEWRDDGALQVHVDEWTVPWPRRLRGAFTVRLGVSPGRAFALDAGGRHHWQPIGPAARIDVRFDDPAIRWSGDAYCDSNWGERPLSRDFRRWDWSRQRLPGESSRVLYAVSGRDGLPRSMDLRFAPDGHCTATEAPPAWSLPHSGWQLARQTRAWPGAAPTIDATLESGPFYCRSLLADPEAGAPWMHESLDMDRFDRPIVQAMLPFRMPRRMAHA